MSISLKKATPEESKELADICKRAFDTDRFYGAPNSEGGPVGYDDPEWQSRAMKWNDYYCVYLDERIVGGIIIDHVNDEHCVLERIFIDPDDHRKGIGTSALIKAEELYAAAKVWTLGTPKWNMRTKAFYESLGYVQVGIEADPEMEGVWYQKTIDPDDPYMMPSVKDLRDGQQNIDIEGRIVGVSKPRNVKSRKGKDLRVANAVLEDETEQITLVLWNEQIDLVEVGDIIRVENGYINSFRGELQLTKGFAGRIIHLNS
jgi:GNAT superfamily N-acetyltransferase